MSANWDLYNARLNINGSSQSERDIQSLKSTLSNKLPSSISYKHVKINNIDTNITIDSTTYQNIKEIKSLPNEKFSVGDYIVWKDCTWLVTNADIDDDVYVDGKMELTNYTIKFQSPNGNILSYPCIADNRIQGTGEKETQTLTLPDGRKTALIPYDENTILLRNGDRLFVDKDVDNSVPYEVTFVDNTKYNFGGKGLIELYLQEDQFNEATDRKDLGICDYFEPIAEPEPVDPSVPQVVVAVECTNDDSFNNNVKLGLEYTFLATFTNELGEVVVNTLPKYTIDNTYDGKVILIDNGNGTCRLRVDSKAYDLFTQQFTLTCTDQVSGFYSSILMTIVSLY